MTIQVLLPQHWQTQRWQNGGGITHQIARADDENGLRWRLSIAEVASDGPFSRFENIDRVILLLHGHGFCLYGAGNDPQVLDSILKPFAFAGETSINCQLINGPVRDFNLMSRRADISATLDVLSLNNTPQTITLAAQSFIYVASGTAQVSINGKSYQLAAEQTLSLSNEAGPLLLSSNISGQVLLIRLSDALNAE